MNFLKTSFVVLSLSGLLSACGSSVVQFPRDGSTDRSPDHVGAETGPDHASNTGTGGVAGDSGAGGASDGSHDGVATDSALDGVGLDGAGLDVRDGGVDLIALDSGLDTKDGGTDGSGLDSKDGGPDGACVQLPVNLRTAAGFAVLAGSTVTNTGPTAVTGDLGVSAGTAITGFPPGTVVGTQHPGDPTAAQAIADLTTAYNDAAGRVMCPISVAGNIGGQTLAPGLYKSTGSLEISSGDLMLDAKGDGSAVFIFQMASTLTTSDGRLVTLANGAKAANIYWQVGTSATLGTTSVFQGTIMADQAITLKTGATLNGRVLARIAAVNLDSNNIVKPAP
jgi:hypothetical protein